MIDVFFYAETTGIYLLIDRVKSPETKSAEYGDRSGGGRPGIKLDNNRGGGGGGVALRGGAAARRTPALLGASTAGR